MLFPKVSVERAPEGIHYDAVPLDWQLLCVFAHTITNGHCLKAAGLHTVLLGVCPRLLLAMATEHPNSNGCPIVVFERPAGN